MGSDVFKKSTWFYSWQIKKLQNNYSAKKLHIDVMMLLMLSSYAYRCGYHSR